MHLASSSVLSHAFLDAPHSICRVQLSSASKQQAHLLCCLLVPACLQRNVYVKGLVAEVAEFLFGDGFAIAGGDLWRARRRAVGPSLHK